MFWLIYKITVKSIIKGIGELLRAEVILFSFVIFRRRLYTIDVFLEVLAIFFLIFIKIMRGCLSKCYVSFF